MSDKSSHLCTQEHAVTNDKEKTAKPNTWQPVPIVQLERSGTSMNTFWSGRELYQNVICLLVNMKLRQKSLMFLLSCRHILRELKLETCYLLNRTILFPRCITTVLMYPGGWRKQFWKFQCYLGAYIKHASSFIGKITDIVSCKHSKVKLNSYNLTQCKNPCVIAKMFGIKHSFYWFYCRILFFSFENISKVYRNVVRLYICKE